METSDSECFESADEEFYSEDEKFKPKNTTGAGRKPIQEEPSQESIINKSTEGTNNVKSEEKTKSNANNTCTISPKTADNISTSIATEKPTDKPEKRDKPKLGSKLGSKIKKSDLNVPHDKTFECETQQTSTIEDHVSHALPTANQEHQHPTVPNTIQEFPSNQNSTSNDNKQNDQSDEELNMWEEDEDWEPKAPQQQQQSNIQEESNMWENDEWEPITDTTDFKSETKTSHNKQSISAPSIDNSHLGWSGWGNWGVSSLLSTATAGVSTITNHVSQGLTTVLESGIGVPDPEELAKLHIAEKQKGQEVTSDEQVNTRTPVTSSNLAFGFGNLVSGVTQITKLVETTGTKVISGGLDTLETIGKKTMEVLQEGDPGLKKKRAFLKIDTDKPVLSQLLREAKEKAEQENKEREEKHFSRKANYEMLFDDHQGLVHLEALEMLSKQCDIKLQTLIASQPGSELIEMQETLAQVKELCELNEDEDEEESLSLSEIKEKLDTAVSEMNVSISYDKLISTWTEAEEWLRNLNLNVCSELELHEQAIDTLAQLTAIAVEQFHKAGELLLIKDHRSTVDETDSLVQLTMTVTALISNVATKLSNKLNEKAKSLNNKENINKLITNVYFEAANSSTYIKDAFHLLIPVLQVGAV